MQWLMASRGEVLQLAENVTAVPFGVGNQTGQDLLPLPFKGILSSYVASPGCFFSFSALGTGYGGRLRGRERSSRWERFLLYNVQLKRREWEQKVSVKQT